MLLLKNKKIYLNTTKNSNGIFFICRQRNITKKPRFIPQFH